MPTAKGLDSLLERNVLSFWSKVEQSNPPQGCWKWHGNKCARGYGRMSLCNAGIPRLAYAHQVSWVIHFSPLPPGTCVLHRCDNPECTNPAHLFLGDLVANNLDRNAKGRGKAWGGKGEAHPVAKMTDADVIEMRELRHNGMTYREIGERFGISRSQASGICRGISWDHVSGHISPSKHKPRHGGKRG